MLNVKQKNLTKLIKLPPNQGNFEFINMTLLITDHVSKNSLTSYNIKSSSRPQNCTSFIATNAESDKAGYESDSDKRIRYDQKDSGGECGPFLSCVWGPI